VRETQREWVANPDVEGNAAKKESNELISRFRGLHLLLNDTKNNFDDRKTIGDRMVWMEKGR
jgi:hypothetical protein